MEHCTVQSCTLSTYQVLGSIKVNLIVHCKYKVVHQVLGTVKAFFDRTLYSTKLCVLVLIRHLAPSRPSG